MRKADYPFLADWFAISLRWLGILGILAALAQANALQLELALALGVAVLWNIFNTLMAAFNQRMSAHRFINVTVDVGISVALFIFSGGIMGPIVWAGVMGILSAAIYIEWYRSLLVALLFPLLEGGWTYYFNRQALTPITLGILFGLHVLIGAVMGIASQLLMKKLRAVYQGRLRLRLENEQQVQRKERERMQVFYHMVEEVSATLNYEVVIDAVLDLSTNVLGGMDTPAGQMVSAVMLFDGRKLKVVSARRFPPRDMKVTLPAEAGAASKAIETGEPQQLADPSKDPEMGQMIILQDCKSALVLPMIRGLNAYGIILYAHPDPDFFTEENSILLEMIGHQAVVSIQNARLFQEVREEKERIVESQEEARKKLARDLHDGPTQSVSSIAMRVNVVRKMMELNTGDPEAELEQIEELARNTTKEIRHMLFTLRPLVLESEGLISALNTMSKRMEQTYQQNVQVDVDEAVVERLEIGKQTVVFFLAEEAVNNARKHAKANQIMVRLKYAPEETDIAALEIIDNGVGFDIESVTSDYQQRGSLGMVNLQERTDLVNGLLKLDSIPGKGTRVRVLIPLTDQAIDRLRRGQIHA